MSMKRSKKSSSPSSKPSQAEGSLGFNPPPSIVPKWEEAIANQPDNAFTPYALTTVFTRNVLMSHPKFGKGLVIGVEGSKIEVLFNDGVRKLGHGGT